MDSLSQPPLVAPAGDQAEASNTTTGSQDTTAETKDNQTSATDFTTSHGSMDMTATSFNLATTTATNSTQPTLAHSSQRSNGSSIATLEPYDCTQTQDSSFTLVNSRRVGRGRGRGRGNRQPNQRLEFPGLNKHEHFSNYKKFFLMKDPNNEPLWPKLNTLEANRELIRNIKGEPKRITELKNGSLLIEVMNKEQSIKIKQIKKLNNIDVVVNEHNSLNSTKGTIYSTRFVSIDDDELLEDLAKYNVTELYKIKKKTNNELTNTGVMILTFDSCTLPENVKLGWTALPVRTYIPRPRQCYKCWRFNHSSKSCRALGDMCPNCGEEGHTRLSCKTPTNCANCDGAHTANDRNCPLYKIETETLAYQTKEKVSYQEAKKYAIQKLSASGISYADIVKKRQNNKTLNTRTALSQIQQSRNQTKQPQLQAPIPRSSQPTPGLPPTPAAQKTPVTPSRNVPNNQAAALQQKTQKQKDQLRETLNKKAEQRQKQIENEKEAYMKNSKKPADYIPKKKRS